MVGQLAHGLDHRRGDGRGGVVVGQVQQDGEPGSALHQGADCAAVASAHDEVAFPMPRYRAVVGFGGPVTDGEDLFGVVDAGPPRMAVRFASCALSGQTLVQIGAQAAPGLHIKAPVDGLVAHLHQLVTGIVLGQHLRDEFGTPSVVHPFTDTGALRVVDEFELFGPHRFLARPRVCHQGVVVAIRVAVTGDLAPDHRPIAPDLGADFGVAEVGIEAAHDLHAFCATEPVSASAGSITIDRPRRPAASTYGKLHAPSLMPPLPPARPRHAHRDGGLRNRRTRTHTIQKLPLHRLRHTNPTAHCNLHDWPDVAMTV